ncbi:nucleoside-diphosphate kinase [Massilibacteroides sp.]|uniref:nucleoside-diphosphate kinase n=1 Tax=Massilibacteroides sp. TaxID=2034766 RepID=UPI0026202736|nr:nucleoside-diphosphate kinase [Massilibacteroides sp.]MDD4516093.1 nucleoside-diphosphate kinase [Massilibacteroides sp.]
MEKTLVILKPGCISRGLIGEIISRFEKKGLRLVGIKMRQLDDTILNEHYAHLAEKPFFTRIKNGMMATPVIVCCWEGIDVIRVVHDMAGKTNGRDALPGTIRGDYSMSIQENIVHTSDSQETAIIEIKRFFADAELFDYQLPYLHSLYCSDELD